MKRPGLVIHLDPHRYRLESLLPGQRTSFGELWLATETGSGDQVVLKFPRQDEHAPQAADHIREEIRFFQALQQRPPGEYRRHLVTLLHHGTWQEQPVMVLEKLHGNLEQWTQENPPPDFQTLVTWCRQIALGLAAVHALERHHRDLKLSNILCDARATHLKLADFGAARPLAADPAHSLAGTPLIMAPEQALPARYQEGRYRYDTDHRSDLYALGLILYRLVTGEYPASQHQIRQLLQEQGEQEALKAHGTMGGLSEEEQRRFEERSAGLLDPDATLVPGVSHRPPPPVRALSKLLQGLLARQKEQRPASAEAVAEQLAALLAELASPGHPPPAGNRPPTPPRRRLGTGARVAGAGLLGLGIGIGWWWWTTPSPMPPPTHREWPLDEGLTLPAGEAPSPPVTETETAVAPAPAPIPPSADAKPPVPVVEKGLLPSRTRPALAPAGKPSAPVTARRTPPHRPAKKPPAPSPPEMAIVPPAKPRQEPPAESRPHHQAKKPRPPEPARAERPATAPDRPNPSAPPQPKPTATRHKPTNAPRRASAITLPGLPPIALVAVPGGTYLMGSDTGPADERPLHPVRVKTFLMMKHPVSAALYQHYCQATGVPCPALPPEPDQRAVNRVSRQAAEAFARWLSRRSGRHCRLPTEAEWEYAARASPVARAHRPLALERLPVNGLGIAGLLGNQWEWVADCAHRDYTQAPDDGSAWGPESGGDCAYAVARGGSWYDAIDNRTATNRLFAGASRGLAHVGFRLACEATEKAP